jgi:hypothetical protein
MEAPRSITFDSRHPEAKDAKVHVVTFKVSKRAGMAGPAGTKYVDCTCDAGRFYWPNLARGRRVTGCWAMQFARRAFGIPTPPFVNKYR